MPAKRSQAAKKTQRVFLVIAELPSGGFEGFYEGCVEVRANNKNELSARIDTILADANLPDDEASVRIYEITDLVPHHVERSYRLLESFEW